MIAGLLPAVPLRLLLVLAAFLAVLALVRAKDGAVARAEAAERALAASQAALTARDTALHALTEASAAEAARAQTHREIAHDIASAPPEADGPVAPVLRAALDRLRDAPAP